MTTWQLSSANWTLSSTFDFQLSLRIENKKCQILTVNTINSFDKRTLSTTLQNAVLQSTFVNQGRAKHRFAGNRRFGYKTQFCTSRFYTKQINVDELRSSSFKPVYKVLYSDQHLSLPRHSWPLFYVSKKRAATKVFNILDRS